MNTGYPCFSIIAGLVWAVLGGAVLLYVIGLDIGGV